MLCQNCNQKEATTRLTITENGAKKEYELCPSCASKAQMNTFLPFTFGTLFSPDIRFYETQPTCSHCGTTLRGFQQTSLVGCEYCYKDLYSGIAPTLKSVQKMIKHTGREPAKHYDIPEEVLSTDKKHLQRLLIDIELAIVKENYEKAAQLRDEIKKLKNTIQETNKNRTKENIKTVDDADTKEDV